MKVSQKTTDNLITATFKSAKIFKGIKIGSEIPALIVTRNNKHDALLEINNNKILATFKKGVPGNNKLILKLEGKEKETFIFKIIDNTSRQGHMEKLSPFTIFNKINLSPQTIIDSNILLSSTGITIFDLNKNILEKELGTIQQRFKGISKLFNSLINKGYSKQFLQTLMFFYYKGDIARYIPLLSVFDNKKQSQQKEHEQKNETIETIINEIQSLDNDTATSKTLIEYLHSLEDQKGTCIVEFPFFMEDKFIPAIILQQESSFIIQAEFSSIGNIEILIKKINKMQITFFVESESIKNHISNNIKLLFEQLGQQQQNINVHLKGDIKNKMIEINQYYSINSAIDVKI